MKLPFVSREAYEERLETNRRLSAILFAERERYDSLLEKYSQLRFAGATVPVETPDIIPLPKPKEDELKTLIGEICGSDYRKRAVMLKQLTMDRAAGISEKSIEAAIREGVPSDGVFA
jgi:hypothetical protein